MPELGWLQSALIRRYPEVWVRHHIASFRQDYFDAFDAEDVARHVGLSLALTDDQPVALEVRTDRDGVCVVEVVGFDVFQFLSTLCSLLAIYGLSIVDGLAFTSDPRLAPIRVRPPARRTGRPRAPSRSGALCEPDRRPRIVDRFRATWTGDAGQTPDWDGFRAELVDLVRLLRADQFEEVHRRLIPRFVAVMGRFRPEPTTLEGIDLTIDVGGPGATTVARIRTGDSFGFLSLTATALAICGVKVVQATVSTQSGRVDDTFWVTDRFGRRIEEESRLRELRLSLILIEHYSSYLPHATNPESALVHFSRFAAETMARPDWGEEYTDLDRPEVLDALVRVLGESDFLWEDFLHAQPENLLPMVTNPEQWQSRRTPSELGLDRDVALGAARDPDGQALALRKFRDRELFRAGIRTILGLNGGPEGFADELSDIADSLLQGADRVTRRALEAELPRGTDGCPVPSVLLALGKCGGREIGFGSDLELMLVYDDRVSAGPVAAQFARYVSTLRQVLAGRREGTFDLDFRLRPYGRAGPPATALSGFTDYFRAGGPAWGYERQALIKLRAIAGEAHLGHEVESFRDDFVYGPEPFDIDSCLRLRRLQVEQLVAPGTVNAKYSPGALVDVEYFVQALQIEHGLAEPRLRTTSTVQAIDAIEVTGRLTRDRAARLRAGYRFYRALIDSLRVVRGHARDLTVPPDGSLEFSRLARRMRRESPGELRAELARTMGAIAALWADAAGLLGRRG
jgi:glutamate-ammonia-ligase adenylyltransferase